MPAIKTLPDVDWTDIRDVEIVRLNIQCMRMAIDLLEIMRKIEVPNKLPLDEATVFKVAVNIYEFVTFQTGGG